MSAERPTPETDAECFVNDGDFVTGDFARRLERERDVARENTKAWHGEYRALNDLHRELGLEHGKAIRQRDRLVEALKVVLEDWKAGYRPEESGKSFDMARAAIAEVEGSR